MVYIFKMRDKDNVYASKNTSTSVCQIGVIARILSITLAYPPPFSPEDNSGNH